MSPEHHVAHPLFLLGVKHEHDRVLELLDQEIVGLCTCRNCVAFAKAIEIVKRVIQ